MKNRHLIGAVQFLIFYTLLVILWGAWVRISHSGDGCGESWPLCHGEMIPDFQKNKTWVEYSHRITSGLFGLFVLFLYVWIRNTFSKGHAARQAAKAMLFFTITEALLGAKLVLLGLVGTNFSFMRTISMSLHQVNSLLLMGFVFLTWKCCKFGLEHRPKIKNKWILFFFLLLATSGTWASLAATLFPSESLLDGFIKDFSADSHHTLRLRVLHPIFGVLFGGGFTYWLYQKLSFDNKIDRETAYVIMFTVLFGIITLLTLGPVWMKITHLALAHISWLALLRWSLNEQTA